MNRFAALALGAVVAVSLAAGCRGKGAGSACESSVHGVLERSISADGGDVPPEVRAMLTKMGDLLVQRCGEDKWNGAVLECLDAAVDAETAKVCVGMLTPQQQKKMNKALGEVMGVTLGGAPAEAPALPAQPAQPVQDDKQKK